MSARLSLYLDDCSDDDDLITFLSQAGHTVISPRSAGTSQADDSDHLEYAAAHDYVLLTYNPRDFRDLHDDWQAQGRTHSGIFVVCFDNDVRRDMNPRDIIHAIDNLLASGLPIANEFHILNQWR